MPPSLPGGVKVWRAKPLVLTALMLVIGLTPFAGASCSSGLPSPVASINVGVVSQEGSIPVFVAADQRFFESNGLDVTLKTYDTGAAMVTGMLNNEVDIATTTSEYVIAGQILKGADIRALACTGNLDYVSIVARKDRGINSIADLAGKKIGVPMGTSLEFFLGRFLTLSNISLSSIQEVNISPLAATETAIESGDVDAVITVSPYTEDALAALGSNGISWPAQGGQAIDLLASCRSSWLSGNSGTVLRFIRAMNQAENFILNHPEEAKSIAKSELGLSDADAAAIWSRNTFRLSLDQSLISAMEDEARWLIANKLSPSNQVPNFTRYLYTAALKTVDPEAVNIIE
jgi:NitT/TauT family transport system substrate-binding protein